MSPQLFQNYPLDDLNTLRISAFASYFMAVETEVDILEANRVIQDLNETVFILGGGSNVLFTNDYKGLVIQVKTKGIKIIKETKEDILLEVMAGESWPEFVEYAVSQNWGGVENLAMIPGNVGSAPVQNIAAYGQNFSNICEKVEVYDLFTGETQTISKSECDFGYRSSLFKNQPQPGLLITKVYIRLQKQNQLNLSYFSKGGRYDSIANELKSMDVNHPSIASVYQAVCNIRTRKLLDWRTHPTVGSFFINPLINQDQAQKLLNIDPEIQFYPAEQLSYTQVDIEKESTVKVPVGRLLDLLGWKGRQIGNCKVHDQWASIFTHNGKATGQEFLEFTSQIAHDVKEKLGIKLESEVSIV